MRSASAGSIIPRLCKALEGLRARGVPLELPRRSETNHFFQEVQLLSFIFGREADVASPQDLSRRRAIVRALMQRNTTQAPKTLWDGLNAIAGAIGARMADNRLDTAEANARKGANARFNAIFDGRAEAGLPRRPAWSAPSGSFSPTLADVLSDPWLSDEQRSIARSVFENPAAPLDDDAAGFVTARSVKQKLVPK